MQSVSTEIKIFGPKFKKSVVKLIRKAKKRIGIARRWFTKDHTTKKQTIEPLKGEGHSRKTYFFSQC